MVHVKQVKTVIREAMPKNQDPHTLGSTARPFGDMLLIRGVHLAQTMGDSCLILAIASKGKYEAR